MVDLKLKKLSLRNWAKFGQVELEFPEKGLVLVTGINSASGGALQSVGSGKSSIGEALTRTLLGVPGRFSSLGKYSTDKKGNTYVRVEADFLGKPLLVEMGYQCKEMSPRGEALRFTYDGKTIERGLIKQTREELTKLLQVSTQLASWTIFVDGRRMDFGQMSQADSVELVMSALRQPPWNEYHENAKKSLANFRRSLAKDEQAQTDADRRVRESRGEVQDAKERLARAENEYKRQAEINRQEVIRIQSSIDKLTESIAKRQASQHELSAKMKTLEETKAAEHHKLEIKQRDLQEAIRQSRSKGKPLIEAMTKASSMATEARTHYIGYKNAQRECPTCKRPLGEELDSDHLAELKNAYDQANTILSESKAKVTAHDNAVTERDDQLDEVQQKLQELAVKHDITRMSNEYEAHEAAIGSNLNAIKQHESALTKLAEEISDESVKIAQATLTERQRVLENNQKQLTEAAKALTVSQETLKVLEYWSMAFSPYGIPNMVLRDAIAPLNHEAQRVSALLTGGTIKVVYNTSRELASGMEKAQLNIEVENLLGDKDLAGSSKGEAGLSNYIISETLAEVGQTARRIGYRWLDEVLPNQDPKVCQTMYQYWKELASRTGILIFLVDHNPVAANYADYTLVAEKKGSPAACNGVAYWR